MLSPINIGATFKFAKIQEEYILSSRKSWKHSGHTFGNKLYEQPVIPSYKPNRDFANVKKIPYTQMDEKRKKYLCYYCDEK